MSRLPNRGLRCLQNEFCFSHGHVEVECPVFQPLLLPVYLRDIFYCARHLWKAEYEKKKKKAREKKNSKLVIESNFNQGTLRGIWTSVYYSKCLLNPNLIKKIKREIDINGEKKTEKKEQSTTVEKNVL